MGTRADFYVGRGESAEWLGSICWDGYPNGHPEPLLAIANEADYRAAVERILAEEHDQATRPEMGWPWPWENSRTTDFAYAFDAGTVWGSCFGSTWIEAATPEDEWPEDKGATFPEMDTAKATLGPRSGVIVVGGKGDPA